jgi:hypothetical protein
MAQVITIAGERLFALKAQNNQKLDIDTFVFANVSGQDPNANIDRTLGLPPVEQRVHTQTVQQVGLVNENVVIYSTVLDSDTGPFEFNWVGLYSSVNQTLIAVSYIPKVTKTITVPGASGNTLNRNFGIEYSGIADLTGITVDAETWQLDVNSRLKGMDELTRNLAQDVNGKNWFIGDGFKVVSRSTANSFKINAGAGYLSGLRCTLIADHILTLSSYPQFVYADAVFDGTTNSIWKAQTTFSVSNAEKSDYIDASGKQHYVFKLARITAANNVEDLRGGVGVSEKIDKHMDTGGHRASNIETTSERGDAQSDLNYLLNIINGTTLPVAFTATALAIAANLKVGLTVLTQGYRTAADGGHAEYVVVPQGTGVHDGANFINLANGNQLKFFGKPRTAKQFGAIPGGYIDTATPFLLYLAATNHAKIDDHYLIQSKTLTLQSNQTLEGCGGLLILNGPVNGITAENAENIDLINVKAIAGDNPTNLAKFASCTTVKIIGGDFDGNGFIGETLNTSGAPEGINFVGCNDFKVNKATLHGFYGNHGVSASYCENFDVSHNTVHHTGRGGIEMSHDNKNGNISDNTLHHCMLNFIVSDAYDGVIDLYGPNNEGITIHNNIIKESGGIGYPNPTRCTGIRVAGKQIMVSENIIYGDRKMFAPLWVQDRAGVSSDDVSFIGNKCYLSGNVEYLFRQNSPARNITVKDNEFIGLVSGLACSFGMQFRASTDGADVNGNVIRGVLEEYLLAQYAPAIQFYDSASVTFKRISIDGNRIKTQEACIVVGRGANVFSVNNNVLESASLSGVISVLGAASNGILVGNVCANSTNTARIDISNSAVNVKAPSDANTLITL